MTTTSPKPRARPTRGLDLELTIPSNKPGQQALMVRATFPEDTVHQNNPESLSDYEKRAGQTLEGLAIFARLLVSLHSGPLTDIVPVPPETRAGYHIADMKNAGGRDGSVITAACLLSKFVQKHPWVHLDIAATAWTDKDRPYTPKGATGIGVQLLTQFLRGYDRQ